MEIEGQYHNVYVIKRPGVDQFMKRVGELYEVVVFTASVSKVNLELIHLLSHYSNLSQVWRSITGPTRHPQRCAPSIIPRELLQSSRKLRQGELHPSSKRNLDGTNPQ